MKPLARQLLLGGFLVCLGGPSAGLLVTVLSMIGAFHTLGHHGVSDPNVLSGYVGSALLFTEVGLILALIVGLPLIIAGSVLNFTSRPPKRT
jgi:biopolymer transport protein ExbB/TolQ